VLVTTLTRYNGNLGGAVGANAKCTAEFGSGWRFAWTGLRHVMPSGATITQSWIQDSASTGSSDCVGWTSSAAGSTGTTTNGMNSNGNNLYGQACVIAAPITCTNI
jgi:hypothetical protein